MSSRTGRAVSILALLLLALVAAGCARIGKPHGWASPEIDGSLYATLERGHLAALDPETYALQWEFPASDEFACGGGTTERYNLEGIYEAPAIGSDTLYFGAYDGAVYAVDRAEGTCKWRYDTGDPIVGGAVLSEDGLYVPSEDGFLYLLDPANGNVITKREVGDTWATPLVLKDAVYVATIKGKLWKLERKTLQPVWDAPFSVDAALLTPPTVNPRGGILVGGIGKKLYNISEEDGSEEWSVSGANWFWGRPTTTDSVIYATNLGKEVEAIDASDGAKLWSFKGQSAMRAGVVLAGDTVVAVDDSGHVYRLSAEDGSLQGQPNELKTSVRATPLLLGKSSAASGSATPTPTSTGSGGGAVLISTEVGELWVLDVTKGQTTQVLR